MNKPFGIVHLHGQALWHDEAFIVGDVDGLRALRDAIDQAIAGRVAAAHVMATDWESYRVIVQCAEMTDAALPYTTDYARNGGVEPWARMTDADWRKVDEG